MILLSWPRMKRGVQLARCAPSSLIRKSVNIQPASLPCDHVTILPRHGGVFHMTSKIEARLAELGLTLPPASQPLNAYQNVVIVNELAFVAGQAPMIGSERPFTGPLATDTDIER